jgi:predicted RNA binding protein YcfA (HicA-like mRNA interferase family)
MGRISRVSGRDVVRALVRRGFVLSHVNGSHHFLRGPGGRVAIVPVHQGRTLAPGTLGSIRRQAGLSAAELAALLDE